MCMCCARIAFHLEHQKAIPEIMEISRRIRRGIDSLCVCLRLCLSFLPSFPFPPSHSLILCTRGTTRTNERVSAYVRRPPECHCRGYLFFFFPLVPVHASSGLRATSTQVLSCAPFAPCAFVQTVRDRAGPL